MRKSKNYTWEHQEFTTYSELNKYIEKIKPVLVGQTIDSIFVNDDNSFGTNKGTVAFEHNILEEIKYKSVECCNLEPAIIKIAGHNLFVTTVGGSFLALSLDTKFEVLNKEEIKYCECSFVFNKNVIGHRISDIYITKATEDDFGFDDYVRDDCISNDMFKNFVIKLENGYRLLIKVRHDYLELRECKKDDYQNKYTIIYTQKDKIN